MDGGLGAWERLDDGEGILDCCRELEKRRALEGKGDFEVAATAALFFNRLVRIAEWQGRSGAAIARENSLCIGSLGITLSRRFKKAAKRIELGNFMTTKVMMT